MRVTRISTIFDEGTGRARTVYRTVAQQPGWVTRAALTLFLLIIALPIVLLFLLALLAAVVLFSVLALAHGAWRKVAGLFGGGSGRSSNIRVIYRGDGMRP
ncbi:MAG: hypothetical protein EA377_05920 [Phycisphaerales bacterium]|nr:MAG: hypothetical protein EA377_05920 [Phycisphaerales bacterium]